MTPKNYVCRISDKTDFSYIPTFNCTGRDSEIHPDAIEMGDRSDDISQRIYLPCLWTAAFA